MIGDGDCGKNRWNEDWQGKPKYSKKTCHSTTLSTKNPTWLDPVLNPGRRGGKPANNRLSYGAACSINVHAGEKNIMSHGGRPTSFFSLLNFVHFRRPTEFNIRSDMSKWTVSLQSLHAGEFNNHRMNALKSFGNYIFTVYLLTIHSETFKMNVDARKRCSMVSMTRM
jgi:hypothetical protein